MPHYKDGKKAHVGDLVFGKPYNTTEEVVGHLAEITSNAEACNCKVVFVQEDNELFCAEKPVYALPPAIVINSFDGKATYSKRAFKVVADYGAVRDFALIKSAAPLPGPVAQGDGDPGDEHGEKIPNEATPAGEGAPRAAGPLPSNSGSVALVQWRIRRRTRARCAAVR